MIDFKHLQGNIIISTAGIGLGIISKKLLKKEFIPISNLKQISMSWMFLMGATILGKKAMDIMTKNNIVKFTNKKNPNEGFIGPLEKENIFFGPDLLTGQIMKDMAKDIRQQ